MKLTSASILVLFLVSTFFVDNSSSFGLITGTITISAASLALIGGVVLLKAVAVKALAIGSAVGSGGNGGFGGFGGFGRNGRRGGYGRRGRREAGEIDSVELEEEAAFAILARTEPEQCYQRLICDLATGQMPESDNDIIPTLFRSQAEEGSSKFAYFVAAQLGKSSKDIKSCELRFSCSVKLEEVLQ